MFRILISFAEVEGDMDSQSHPLTSTMPILAPEAHIEKLEFIPYLGFIYPTQLRFMGYTHLGVG